MKTIGSIILIEHSGKPTVWQVHESKTIDDLQVLLGMFEKTKQLCSYELSLGGTVKLFDNNNIMLAEQTGRAISPNPLYNKSVTKEAT
jgi:hypothetical protein